MPLIFRSDACLGVALVIGRSDSNCERKRKHVRALIASDMSLSVLPAFIVSTYCQRHVVFSFSHFSALTSRGFRSQAKPNRSGQVKSSQVKSGQVQSSQAKRSQVKSSQIKSGQVKAGQVKPGQVK